MATTYKVLGQVAPADTTATTLYTVPADTDVIVSTISVTNVTAVDAGFRVHIRVAGAAASAANALVFDSEVPGNDFILITSGLTLSSTDVLTVKSNVGGALTFQAFGSEVSE
jgi:hypothetical protein